MRWLAGLGLWVLMAFLSASAQASIEEKDPAIQVKKVSEQLMSRLDKERAALEKDGSRIQALAEELVFPYVDVAKMSRFVMGAHWRTATPEQQQDFVAAFKALLLNSYARSFLKMQIDHIDVAGVRSGAGKTDVEVPANVTEKSGNVIPVVFRLLPSGNTWKVYDVEIQGISLLLNYRTVYAVEIDSKGLPSVLAQMKAQANAQ